MITDLSISLSHFLMNAELNELQPLLNIAYMNTYHIQFLCLFYHYRFILQVLVTLNIRHVKTTTLALGVSDECPSQIKYGLHTLKSYYHGYFTPFKIAIELTLCFAEFTTVGSSKRNMIRYYRICLWGNVRSYVSSDSFFAQAYHVNFFIIKGVIFCSRTL